MRGFSEPSISWQGVIHLEDYKKRWPASGLSLKISKPSCLNSYRAYYISTIISIVVYHLWKERAFARTLNVPTLITVFKCIYFHKPQYIGWDHRRVKKHINLVVRRWFQWFFTQRYGNTCFCFHFELCHHKNTHPAFIFCVFSTATTTHCQNYNILY